MTVEYVGTWAAYEQGRGHVLHIPVLTSTSVGQAPSTEHDTMSQVKVDDDRWFVTSASA